jgi:PAS domain S-box-containing protein
MTQTPAGAESELGVVEQTAAWFFANSQDMFGVITREGVFLQVNPAWEAVAGWRASDLIGRSLLDLVHPDSRDDVVEMGLAVARVGHSAIRMRLACRNGDWAWLEGHAQAGPNGEVMGALRDVTEEIRRAEDLRRARQAESLLSETAGVGLWRYDPRTDEIEWSQAWRTMLADLGLRIRNGKEFADACHPDDLARVRAVMDKAIRFGESGGFDHRCRDGAGRWTSLRVHVRAERAAEGLHIVYGISQNITEAAEAITALTGAHRGAEAQTQRLKIALWAAKAVVVEIDYDARTLWLSPQFAEVIGRSMTYDEAKQAVWPFVHPDDGPMVAAAVRDWLKGAPVEPLEVRIMLPDGGYRWVAIYTDIQKHANGRWRRGVNLLMDIDERKRQELALIEAERAAKSATEAKSQFLANMSHEIRTPMNGVLGVLHLLKSRPLAEADRAMLDEALTCGALLQALIDDVVDFSRLEAGQFELRSEPLDPAALVEGVANLLRPGAEDKGLALSVRIDALPRRMMGDPVRLRQCLFNLVGNAIKFTPGGSVSVRAFAHGAAGELRMRVEVADTGIGVPQDARAKIFGRFQQADASTTRRFGGSGLGLAITRELVTLMGGEVGYASEVGRGSTFWIEIPAVEIEAADEAGVTVDNVLEGIRILVVEDNPTNRLIVTKMLEGLGASVETAEDGERGVEAATGAVFDLILMDVQMPGIDGLEATRRIRASAAPSARTPIIALTANVLAHQRQAYFAAGMDAVVGKPISPDALVAAIAELADEGERLSASPDCADGRAA